MSFATTATLFDAAVAVLPAAATAANTAHIAELRRALGAKPNDAQARLALQEVFATTAADGDQARLRSDSEQAYWVDAACYGGNLAAAPVRHIGAWFERHGKRWFVRTVLSNGPAARAGLERGDEIVDVGGRPLDPVASFTRLGPHDEALVRYRRLPWESPKQVRMATEVSSLPVALLRDLRDSYYTRQVKGRRIAYVRLALSCHPDFAATLRRLTTRAQMQDQALVLDLRGDYGDGGLTYLEPFVSIPTQRDRVSAPVDLAVYAKPLVVLIDAGTSGGRESLAAFLQKHQRAVVVGVDSAGATAPGRAVALETAGYLMWLPDAGAKSAPLTSDVVADASVLYAAGSDAPLDEAFNAAVKALGD